MFIVNCINISDLNLNEINVLDNFKNYNFVITLLKFIICTRKYFDSKCILILKLIQLINEQINCIRKLENNFHL